MALRGLGGGPLPECRELPIRQQNSLLYSVHDVATLLNFLQLANTIIIIFYDEYILIWQHKQDIE